MHEKKREYTQKYMQTMSTKDDMRDFRISKLEKQLEFLGGRYGLRPCKGVYETYKNETIYFGIGYFHNFGIAYEKTNVGCGQFSTAIVELPNGELITTDINNIQFIDTEDKVE